MIEMKKAKELFDFRKESLIPKGIHIHKASYNITAWTTYKRHKELRLTPKFAINLRYVKPKFRGNIYLFDTHIKELNKGLVWGYRNGKYVFYVAPYISDGNEEML